MKNVLTQTKKPKTTNLRFAENARVIKVKIKKHLRFFICNRWDTRIEREKVRKEELVTAAAAVAVAAAAVVKKETELECENEKIFS